MRSVDEVLLDLIEAAGVTVHDGLLEANNSNVVTYDLPYVVYASSIGDDHSPRLDGRTSRRSVFFTVTYVGLDRTQAKWAGELVRGALEGKRIAVPGSKTFLVELLESQRVRRDDDAIRPDGSPLFYGVDNYAVSLTRVRT